MTAESMISCPCLLMKARTASKLDAREKRSCDVPLEIASRVFVEQTGRYSKPDEDGPVNKQSISDWNIDGAVRSAVGEERQSYSKRAGIFQSPSSCEEAMERWRRGKQT